ncbi:MAG: hypothetical protein H0V82_05870 [Candidatus Protochlamydia sp.]|nr:hypothetical protein [Candidatus Protochlamydia sp.]
MEICNNRNNPITIIYLLQDMIEKTKMGKIFESPETGSNEVRFLKGSNDHNIFVFKPFITGRVRNTNMGIAPESKGKREHVAHLLNFSGQFPISICLYTKIGNLTGSMQLFVNGLTMSDLQECFDQSSESQDDDLSKNDLEKIKGSWKTYYSGSLASEDVPNLVNNEEIHKLLLYDILMWNCDRNDGNILFCLDEKKDAISIIGIDHGECFSSEKNANFKMDAFELFPALNEKFFPESCLELIKEGQLNEYINILT